MGTADVIGVKMGIDNCFDRLVGDLLELSGCQFCSVHTGHRIYQNAGIVAFDQGAIDHRIMERTMDVTF